LTGALPQHSLGMAAAKDEKEKKALEKTIAKIVDENEDNFCGVCSLQVIDEYGYQKKTKGAAIEAPLFIVKEGGTVKLVAEFTPNPIFFLHLKDEGDFLYGKWWYGPGNWSRSNQICQLVPKLCKMPKEDNWEAFACKAEVPFLKGAPSRLSNVTFAIKEEKFTTKIVKATVEMSEADWKEWKAYRVKLWGVEKAWGGGGGGGDEDKEGKEEKDKGEE